MIAPDWNGQNIPKVHKEYDGSTFAILPIMEYFLGYNEGTITDLLPTEDSYGWNDDITNAFAWANNAYRVVYFVPDFSRYGCLPAWFPKTDRLNRPLTDQGQVNRFLYLLDLVYGGLPEDHTQVNIHSLVEAILELHDNLGEYVDIEEGDGMEWETQ
jgi:hypothetical protein